MSIVLPIVLFAVLFGLFVPENRVQRYRWMIVVWIAAVVALYWVKNPSP